MTLSMKKNGMAEFHFTADGQIYVQKMMINKITTEYIIYLMRLKKQLLNVKERLRLKKKETKHGMSFSLCINNISKARLTHLQELLAVMTRTIPNHLMKAEKKMRLQLRTITRKNQLIDLALVLLTAALKKKVKTIVFLN